MNSYLTYNKLINLLTVFYYNKDWHNNSIDYIKEKYFRTFKSLPDKNIFVKDGIVNANIDNNYMYKFHSELTIYENKWGKILDKDILLLFVVYYLSNGNLSPKYLINRYSDLFTSFRYISNEPQKYGLHELIKEQIDDYEMYFHNQLSYLNRIDKILAIKKYIK